MVETPGWDDDPLERRALSLAALIRKVWRDITKSFVASLAGKPTVALADTGKIRTDWGTQLGSVVLGHIRQTYMDGSNHIAQATNTDVDQQIGDDLVVAHLTEARNRLVGLGDDVWKAVRAQITMGTNAGESVQQIAQRVKNVAGVSTKRSLTIARTETHMAYESGAHAQAMFVDPEAEKTWVATNDTRTRETHQAVDGQTIKINETFTVGGQALRFPGDPLGGGESINCRCTTTYEFGDIISPVSDGEMSDLELALAAAGKKDWDPKSHPRGADGKFIKKGTAGWLAVTSTKGEDILAGVQAMKQSEWDKLTTQQQTNVTTKLIDSADITADQFTQAVEKISALGAGTAGEDSGVDVSFIPDPTTTTLPTAGQALKIPAGLKGKPGDPVKVTTSVIWGKHDPGTVVLEAPGQQVVWDGKKYQIAEVLPDGSQLTTANSGLTKKDAYAQLKNDTHWLVPGSLGYGDGDDKFVGVSPEFHEKPQTLPGNDTPTTSTPATKTLSDPDAKALSDVIDLSGLKKTGGQKGSNPGGTYEDPLFPGVSMYVKKAKSPKHAANEVAASALYNLAGVTTPQVFKATGAAGLGNLQTVTNIVPNVKGTLGSKLNDENFLKKIRDDFAVDAWLGNWDTVGLSYDNIVVDAQGNPRRIDVGGALLFRAQGTPKGDKFGDEVIEIETLRNPSVNPQSAQIFGSMTDDEIRASVAKVAAISDADIDEIIKQSGLPKSVATTLKNRRDDLVKKYPPTAKSTTPTGMSLPDLVTEFILDKDEFSAENAVLLANQMDKGTWNALASDEKDALKQLLTNAAAALYEDGFISDGDVVSEDLTKLKMFDVLMSSVPTVSTEADIAKETVLDLTPKHIETKNFLLGEAESGLLTQKEAISLTNLLTVNDISNMSKNQHKNWAAELEQAVINDLAAAKSAWQKYKTLKQQNTSMDVPWAAETVNTGAPSTPLDENAFALIAEDGQSNTLITGDVVAILDDGSKRIVWSASTEEFIIEEWNGTEWVEDLSTGYPLYDSDDNPIDADQVFVDLLVDYPENTWLKPTSTDLGPKPEVLDPPAYSQQDVIDHWPGVANDDVKPTTVIALSPDGKFQIMKSSSNFYVIMTKNDSGEWISLHGGNKHDIASIAAKSSGVWVVPPKTPAKPADLSDGPLPTKVVFESGLTSGKAGDVVAVGTIQDLDWAEYRLVVVPSAAATLTNALKLEVRNKGANSNDWVYMSTYASHDDFINDWPGGKFTWHKPTGIEPTTIDAPSAELPSTTPQAPAVAPPAVTMQPTVANGDDISKIPHYHKANFKKLLSANSATKVGYWSKPEKIWDKVKEIQAQYPDPNQPGGSKYTPLQILKSLDSLTNTKEPNPYETKITKWTATAKGSAYISKDGAPTEITTTVSDPTHLTAGQLATGIFNDFDKMDVEYGDVLFEGIANNGTKWMAYADTDSKSVFLKYKKPGTNQQLKFYTDVKTSDQLATMIDSFNLKPTGKVNPIFNTPVSKATAPKLETGADTGLNMGDGDISHVSDPVKQDIYADFKKQPSTYLSSPEKSIFLALKQIGNDHNLNTLQALKIIDEVGAKKVNKPNQFLFEKKILDWLKTPKGVAVASGQSLPKPSRPAFKTGITPNIPSFEASDNFTYNIITNAQADTIQAEMHAKYGGWTTPEKSGLRAYTGGIYYSINSYLYGETDDISSTNENAMNNAQKGMRPSTQPMLLHRGVGWSGVGATSYSDLQKKVGQTWRNDGFSSTSVGGKAAFSHNPVLMEIEAPPGTPMAWVKPISLHSSENEMLLAAGTTYKILSVKQTYSQTVVRLRVVPEEENQ